MALTEEQFVQILDEIIDETLDLKKQERVRFTNALVERLLEEDAILPDEDPDDIDPDLVDVVDFSDD